MSKAKKGQKNNMTNINKLISTYYNSDGENMTASIKKHKAECTSNEYNKKQKLEANRKNRHLLLDQLLNEIPFNLNENQIQQIRYWIDSFNPYFKDFHRQASNETILLAFIMIQRKQVNKRLNVEKFTINRKYKLTQAIFTSIQNQLIFELMRTTPLTYNQSLKYNHEILEKKGY